MAGKVVFHSVLTGNLELMEGDIIKFNRINTNIGSGYNNVTGVFSAPRDGTYVFHTTVLTTLSSHVSGFIGVNADKKVFYRAWGTNAQAGTGSQTYMTDLRAGEQVAVHVDNSTTVGGDSISTFSGHLVG